MVKCKLCSSEIRESSRTKFCSDKCMYESKAEKRKLLNASRIKQCESCLETFEDLGKNNQKEFCNPKCLAIGQKARSYGLKPNSYFKMKMAKDCPMCKLPFDSKSRIQCIDHCHSTGRVRGLICRKCNTVLGQVGDHIPTLERLAKYLRGEL